MKSKVPLLKITLPKKNKLFFELKKTFDSGNIGEGKKVKLFENNFSRKFNFDNVLAVSSGTAALHLAFILSNIKKGDEVISTSMTAEPTNTSIIQSGGKPIFADVDEKTGNISPQSIRKCINKKTRAICVVHYGGYPAEIEKISKIAKKFKLFLIEDCAHALGAKHKNKNLGSFGDFSTFSFQAIKQFTTIDGGMLVIKNKKYFSKAKQLRWFGLQKGVPRVKNRIIHSGYKYNMNDIEAGIGILQLKQFWKIDKKIKSNAKYYLKNIKNNHFKFSDKNDISSFWLFTLLTKQSGRIIKLLNENGIESSKIHLPNHYHPVFKNNFKFKLKNLEKFYSMLVHIPCGWWVKKNEREKIVKIINSVNEK